MNLNVIRAMRIIHEATRAVTCTRDLRDTGAMLYQLSYEATHWERGQFIEFKP